jgi:hypothetical protein
MYLLLFLHYSNSAKSEYAFLAIYYYYYYYRHTKAKAYLWHRIMLFLSLNS